MHFTAGVCSIERNESAQKVMFVTNCQTLSKAEYVQLRFGVQNRPYFENSGPKWSKLGSFVDKHHIHNFTE